MKVWYSTIVPVGLSSPIRLVSSVQRVYAVLPVCVSVVKIHRLSSSDLSHYRAGQSEPAAATDLQDNPLLHSKPYFLKLPDVVCERRTALR